MDPTTLIAALRRLLPSHDADGPARHYLQLPMIGAAEKDVLNEVLDDKGRWVSNMGPQVRELEKQLEEFTGFAHTVVCVNGTTALQIALELAGVGPMHSLPGFPGKPQRDMVICPSLTFVATANAITHRGAVPAFVDAESETLGMDPAALAAFLTEQCERRGRDVIHVPTGFRVAAVMPVHIFGNPCRIEEIAAVAADWGVPIVEDVAESLGAWVGERHSGRFSVACGTSFNGNKLITTGGGGAIFTDDAELAARAKHITATAKDPTRPAWNYWHDDVAYNYRMPNLNAAFGLAQMGRLAGLLEQKERLFHRWKAILGDIGLSMVEPREGTTSNRWLNAVQLPAGTTMEQRNELLMAVDAERMYCRPIWVPMHLLPMYQHCPRGPLAVTEDMERRILCVPSTARLADY